MLNNWSKNEDVTYNMYVHRITIQYDGQLCGITWHQEMQKSSSENCKRPPEPPKDKNGHPLPPPKDHNNSHASKGQPPHDDKHLCPPQQGNKKP